MASTTAENPEVKNIIQQFKDLKITTAIPENDLKALLKEVYRVYINGSGNQEIVLSQISSIIKSHLESIKDPKEEEISNVVQFFRASAEDDILNKLTKILCPAQTLLVFANVLFPHITSFIQNSKAESHALDQKSSALLHKTVRVALSLVKSVSKLKLKSKNPQLLEPLTHLKEIPDLNNEHCNTEEEEKEGSTSNSDKISSEADTTSSVLNEFGLVFLSLINNHPNATLDIKYNAGLILCYLVSQEFLDDLFCTQTSSSSGDFNKFEIAVREYLNSDYLNKLSLCYGCLQTCGDFTPEFMSGIATAALEQSNNSTREAINLGSARVLEIWSQKVSPLMQKPEDLAKLTPVFKLVEIFSFTYIAGHIDAVKNCCRNMIRDLSNIYYRLDTEINNGSIKEDSLLNDLLLKIISQPYNIKWVALASATRKNPHTSVLLDLWTDAPEKMLCAERSHKSSASEAYIALMKYTFPIMETSTWIQTWISPLFRAQPSHHVESNWPQKKFILGKVINVKNCETGIQQCILKEILAAMGNSSSSSISGNNKSTTIGSDTPNLLVSTESSCLVVECLKIGAELGIKINPFQNENDTSDNHQDDFFRGVLPRHIMNSWTSHANPQIRLASFTLLVDTKKTSELLTPRDFDTIKLIFKYNLVSQNPAFRQQFLSHFKKLMRRLKDGKNYAARTKREKDVENYDNFITWAWNFFITEGLFAGANFSRRAQSLNCLAELRLNFQIENFQKEGDENKQTEEALKFLAWLDDSYENNKMAAVEILSKTDIKIFNDKNFCESLFAKSLVMLTSVRPPDSVTARHILLLLLKKSFITPLGLVETIILKLEAALTMTKETSLFELTTTCPPYGMFRSLRQILNIYQKEILEEALLNSKQKENTTTKNGVTFQSLQLLFQRLLSLSLEFDELLLPVLGSAAPEGFLPALSKQAKMKDIPSEEYNIVRSINAQMLLVGSWRSMKEICILLIEICVAFPLEGETQSNIQNGIVTEETKSFGSSSNPDYVFKFEQVEKIGVHLVHLLMNLMHRGVFEQVYVGFKSLAHRLKKSKNVCLNKLAETWLDEIMNDKSRVGDKCITRRSAGLPYIFQALLTPEVENEDFLKYWMEKLMEYSPVTVVRIHSMNILRGLYKDANFSRALMQWVPQGIEMAFRGLRATEWGERNSGLMLFGAVIRRCFGPKLNLMSAPTFFRKFPQMYDFLLKEIKTTANISGFGYKSTNMNPDSCKSLEGQTQQDNNNFAYYILLLFSCFSTAPGKIEEGNFKLLEFIPYIQACGGNSDIQVRTIAAKSIIPFITSPEERTRILESSLDNLLFHSRRIRNNLIHGDLLQLISLVKLFQSHEEEIPSHLIEKFQLIIDIVKNTKCPVIFEVFANLSITLADSISIPQTQSNSHLVYTVAHTMQKVTESAFSTLYPASFAKRRNSIVGLAHADLAICKSILRFCVFGSSNENDDNIKRWINEGAPCITEELLSILIREQEQEINKEKGQNDTENRNKGSGEGESEEIEQSSSNNINTSTININMNINPAPLLIKRYLKEDFHFSAQTDYEYKFLVYFSNCRVEEFQSDGEEGCSNEEIIQVMEKLAEICEGEFGTVHCRATAMKFLSKLAFCEKIKGEKYRGIVCNLFVELSDTTYDDEIRVTVAESIPILPLDLKQFSAEEFSKIWTSLFKLALDDEIFIRDEAFKRLSGNGEVPGCHLKCLEMFVDVFFNQIKDSHSIEAIWSLVALLMTEDFDIMNCSAEDDDEDRLFEKSEMNLFRETVTLTNLVFDYLKEHQEILNILKTRLATTTMKENPKGYQLYNSLINSRTISNSKNETVPMDNNIDISNLEQLKNVVVNYTSLNLEEKQPGNSNHKELVSLLSNSHNNLYDDNFLSKLLTLHDNDKSVVNTHIRRKIECLFLS